MTLQRIPSESMDVHLLILLIGSAHSRDPFPIFMLRRISLNSTSDGMHLIYCNGRAQGKLAENFLFYPL